MVSNKRTVLGIAIMTVIFLVFSIFLVHSMYNGLKPNHESKFNDSYVTIIKDKTGIELQGNSIKEHTLELESKGYDTLIMDKKFEYYYRPCFNFIITLDGILIKSASTSDFYNYQDLEVGSLITMIDDVKISEVNDYNEVLKLILSDKLEVTKAFTLSNGKVVNYKYLGLDRNNLLLELNNNSLNIKINNLDNLNVYSLYKAITADEFKHVSSYNFDLKEATISSYDSLCKHLSLFANRNEKLFKNLDVISSPGLKLEKKVYIDLGDNKDLGINFFVNAAKSLNDKISVKGNLEAITTFKALNTYEDYNYVVNLYDTLLEVRKVSSGGDLV